MGYAPDRVLAVKPSAGKFQPLAYDQNSYRNHTARLPAYWPWPLHNLPPF